MTEPSAFVPQLLLTGLIWLTTCGFAGGSSQESQFDGQEVIRAEVNLVNVLFTVTDEDGKFVNDLTKSDFEVYEDGVKQNIRYFANYSRQEAIPLTIAMLVDTSGSVRAKLEVEKQTAAEFFRSILRPQRDLACLIQFDSDVNLVQDFTDDIKRLISALDALRAGNSTSLYDAIYLAVTEKLNREAGRKVIVVLSDGDDTSSRVRKGEAIEAAQKNDVIIYGIGIRDPEYPADFRVLKDFAKDTGGRFFKESARFERLRQAFRQISEDIKNQYSLAYISTNQKKDGTFRRLQIKCRNKGLKVNHRRGYYAPPG